MEHKMKTLILGASGFLGGTIYFKLKNLGNDVLGTYNKNTNNTNLIKQDVFDVAFYILLIDINLMLLFGP